MRSSANYRLGTPGSSPRKGPVDQPRRPQDIHSKREILDATLCIVRGGIPWRLIPSFRRRDAHGRQRQRQQTHRSPRQRTAAVVVGVTAFIKPA